jgi:hypothetical protein
MLIFFFSYFFLNQIVTLLEMAVPKENVISQIVKKPIRNGRLALSDLKKDFFEVSFIYKKNYMQDTSTKFNFYGQKRVNLPFLMGFFAI